MIEDGHSMRGKSLAGSVLIAHSGKGSSVVQMDGLYKISVRGKGPAAVVLRNPDPVFVSALLIMEIPSVYSVDEAFYEYIAGKDGAKITVDPSGGSITVEGE
jgi:predicted aconitase with swiveling domain